jgi:hypothetical protein
VKAGVKDPFEKDDKARLLDDRQLAYYEDWLRRSADRLGLREFIVRGSPYPCDSGVAQTFIEDESDRIFVALSRDTVESDTPDEQREALAHELLHPYFHRVSRAAERLIKNELGYRTEALFEEALEIFEELSLDRLARAVAPFLDPFELPKAAD